MLTRHSPFRQQQPQQQSDANSSDALLQQQIRDVLLLDQSPSSLLQVEQIQRTLMSQAQQPHDQRSEALVSNGAAGSAMQHTLQQAFEQHGGPQRYHALQSAPSARPAASYPSGALMPVNAGALAFAHSQQNEVASFPPSLDAGASRSVVAVDAQLAALHESLRRFKFARMGQAMEFRAALPEAAAAPVPAASAAAPFQHKLRGQSQLQQQPPQHQQARLLPPSQPQHQQAPSWPSAVAAAPSSLSPDYFTSNSLAATAASSYAGPAHPQHHPAYGYSLQVPAPSAASISVIHSPANTVTRPLQPQTLAQQPHPAFRQPTPPLSLDQQWMQQQALSQQYAHLLSPSNALGASAPHYSTDAHAGMQLTRPDSGHRSARGAAVR